MRINRRFVLFESLLLTTVLAITGAMHRLRADCDPNPTPFTDLGAATLCQGIFAAYFSGLTAGTSATTFSPLNNVTREQMTTFVTRTLEQSLKRGSRRAAHNQWWVRNSPEAFELASTPVGDLPRLAASDGADIWVASQGGANLTRVRASDGAPQGTFSVPDYVYGVLIAMGRVFLSREICDGADLIMIDPKTGVDTTVASNLGNGSKGIAFDGAKIWTANDGRNVETPCVAGGSAGSLSMVTPGASTPWSVVTVTAGFSRPYGMLFDGSHIWVTDRGDDRLKKINPLDGSIIQSIPVGIDPGHPVFDGINIWVPNYGSDNISVVRVKDGAGTALASAFVLRTLNAPFMVGPQAAAFDGERVLITCSTTTSNTDGLFLFKASDLSLIFATSPGVGTKPFGVCSDGLNFWVTLNGTDKLVRY